MGMAGEVGAVVRMPSDAAAHVVAAGCKDAAGDGEAEEDDVHHICVGRDDEPAAFAVDVFSCEAAMDCALVVPRRFAIAAGHGGPHVF
eukprot:10187350-Prorocentrum_lima.AAC.1